MIRGKAIDVFNYACVKFFYISTAWLCKEKAIKNIKTNEDHKNMLMGNHNTAVLQVDLAENFSTLW